MKNKVIKYGSQTYAVKRKKIKSIDFEVLEDYTIVRVFYAGILYPDFAMNIQNKNKKVNTELLSDVYISIMALNDELLKEAIKI